MGGKALASHPRARELKIPNRQYCPRPLRGLITYFDNTRRLIIITACTIIIIIIQCYRFLLSLNFAINHARVHKTPVTDSYIPSTDTIPVYADMGINVRVMEIKFYVHCRSLSPPFPPTMRERPYTFEHNQYMTGRQSLLRFYIVRNPVYTLTYF